MLKNVIYAIKCGTSNEYIGETKRSLATKTKEHQDATRLGQWSKSAVAEHTQKHDIPHNIEWEIVTVIDKGKSKFNLILRGKCMKHQRKPGMNRDDGIECSATWNSVL